jgi:transposase
MHQQHKAGDKLFVDFAGKKLPYIDPDTGELCQAEVFVAVLGASQKTYVQACRSQQLADYIDACQSALFYFHGAPRAIVTDNLRAGVSKSDKYEPLNNENFAAFGRHYNTTILAARAFKP